RSRDGGETWSIENPAAQGALIPVGAALHGITPPGLKEKPWQDCPGGIDFTHPDFALTVRMTDVNAGPSRFSYSTDRGKTWQGPLPPAAVRSPGHARTHGLHRQRQGGRPVVLNGGEEKPPRGPAALRAHHRRRPHLEVRVMDRRRAQGVCHHAGDGAAE